MILPDHAIRRAVASGRLVVDPFVDEMVQPASLDLVLGDEFVRVYSPEGGWWLPDGRRSTEPIDPWGEDRCSVGGPVVKASSLVVRPGEIVLGTTAERVEVPPDLVVRVEGKSSIARVGMIPHAAAGFVDPGFRGRITLEIVTLGGPIRLEAGRRIAQLSIHEMLSASERPYGSAGLGSHYQDQATVWSARFDPVAVV